MCQNCADSVGMRFTWDDYTAPLGRRKQSASTDRGWGKIRDKVTGVDTSHPIGNYLSYAPLPGSRGPNGETVHAVAYYARMDEYGHATGYTVNLDSAWFGTIADAKAWIEATVTKALSEQVSAR